MKRNPRIFFSFRSPFSWLAVERLMRAVPDAMERIEFIPYWEPDRATEQAMKERGARFHYVQMSKAKQLYILHDVKRLARESGFDLVWPVDRDPWWEPSHLGWLKARTLGAGSAFYRAVTAARWLQGEDISKPEVIGSLADSIALDPETIVGASSDERIRAEGVDCLVEAFQDDIFGVPYFRYGNDRFWGVDRVDRFLDAYRGRAAGDTHDSAPELISEANAYDTDTGGGCG